MTSSTSAAKWRMICAAAARSGMLKEPYMTIKSPTSPSRALFMLKEPCIIHRSAPLHYSRNRSAHTCGAQQLLMRLLRSVLQSKESYLITKETYLHLKRDLFTLQTRPDNNCGAQRAVVAGGRRQRLPARGHEQVGRDAGAARRKDLLSECRGQAGRIPRPEGGYGAGRGAWGWEV